MFGFPRLKSLLAGQREHTSLVDFLLAELKDFTGETWEQEDDVTLVTLHRMPEEAMPKEQPEQANPGEMLLTWSVASQPGNEQAAMELVADAVAPLHLPAEGMANMKTAVAEVVMNAMEHDKYCHADKIM